MPSLGQPFVISIFYKESKPQGLQFLDEFVKEYECIKDHGISYNGLISLL